VTKLLSTERASRRDAGARSAGAKVAASSCLFVSDLAGPVNLGNPEEATVLELAERVRTTVGAAIPIEFTERPEDDPQVRRPDISLARLELGWQPKVPLDTGLELMVAWASEPWTT
jgi:nucleoside-diphosphate-sugar epimerase